jgi:plastocyanin
MKNRIYHLSVAFLSFCIILLYSCGGGKSATNNTNPTGGGSPGNPVATASATIQNFAFSPAKIYLKPGGTISWTNKDATPHTVTDNGNAFDSGSMAVDEVYTHTFPTTPGTYTYHCTFHSMMANAQVIVGN